MKHKFFSALLAFALFLLPSCGNTKKPYPLKYGCYEFQKFVATDTYSQETIEQTIHEVIFSPDDEKWDFLLGFTIFTTEETEFIHLKDGRCVTLYKGLVFELVAENTLQVELKNWRIETNKYNITVTLGWVQLYG